MTHWLKYYFLLTQAFLSLDLLHDCVSILNLKNQLMTMWMG